MTDAGRSETTPAAATDERGRDSQPRDTVPTSSLALSTLPPSSDAAELAAPSTVHRGAPAVSPPNSSTTMQSAAYPGAAPSAAWDERRIAHLERELAQLTARQRLIEKRLAHFAKQLRVTALVAVVAFALAMIVLLLARRHS